MIFILKTQQWWNLLSLYQLNKTLHQKVILVEKLIFCHSVPVIAQTPCNIHTPDNFSKNCLVLTVVYCKTNKTKSLSKKCSVFQLKTFNRSVFMWHNSSLIDFCKLQHWKMMYKGLKLILEIFSPTLQFLWISKRMAIACV